MKSIKEYVNDRKNLSDYLKNTGISHKNYKMYTSMERALGFLLSGDLYLSDGQNWNDSKDKEAMKREVVFARSFSCSTTENVAMWMLYGDRNGKNGAMLNFYPSVIKHVCEVSYIEYGKFDSEGKFLVSGKLFDKGQFKIFCTDVLYVEKCKNEKAKLTLADEHVTVSQSLIEHEDIYYKNYAWSYEKECRLILKILDPRVKELIKKEETHMIRIKVPEPYLRQMRKDRLVRSPVYCNAVDYGRPSNLTGEVIWDL